jgi:death on curing protein
MTEPIWIDAALVLAIHDRQLAEHGGAEGLRDESLLHSALARPTDDLAYANADTVVLAAKYTAGIVKNHPFVDGTKRTGFMLGILFLELNGHRFTASEEDAAQAVLNLASGTMDEGGYCEFLRAHAQRK